MRKEMYDRRIRVFIIISLVFLALCLMRLIQMQLLPNASLSDEIENLKIQQGRSKMLKTLRGTIFDRNGIVLATDEPKFYLYINYKITAYMDSRFVNARLLNAAEKPDKQKLLAKTHETLQDGRQKLDQIIEKLLYLGADQESVIKQITRINDIIWDLRTFQAWRENCTGSELYRKNINSLGAVKAADFVPDFEKLVSDANQRLILIDRVDISEMSRDWELLELKTDDDIFTAQMAFIDIDGIALKPQANRVYPYGSVAAQTISWVGPEQEKKLFSDDKFLRYMEGEVSGRGSGVEYVCEDILRGKRGRIVYDIDNTLVEKTSTQFGQDVTLTLDIELQKRIEEYLFTSPRNPGCKDGRSVVLIDVASGDILALVSMPVFDLNHIRENWDKVNADGNEPLINRAIDKQYPPGSIAKPLILIAGLETDKVTPNETISCPSHPPTGRYWPRCWIERQYGTGHDQQWDGDGGNKARNAIRGSCNVYFSHLGSRIDSRLLQEWLFKFGLGHKIPLNCNISRQSTINRTFKQVAGAISSINPDPDVQDFDQEPPLKDEDRKYFGIGQGNLSVTPLQAANAIATIARGGIYKLPRLFLVEDDQQQYSPVSLEILPQSIDTVREGMYAVVNERNGTAYQTFSENNLQQDGVKVFGKTGSTEGSENAWFAGFAEDRKGRCVAVAVVVEGGQHGASDAAPLARDILQFCVDLGYLGNGTPPTNNPQAADK